MHRTPQRLTTSMSHLTSHEVLTLLVSSHAVAALQSITVQTQTIVLQSPTTFFPGNAHPHRMLACVQQESYCIFLDVGAHNRQSNDCAYVIVRVERVTCTPLDVDHAMVIPRREYCCKSESTIFFVTMTSLTVRPMQDPTVLQ